MWGGVETDMTDGQPEGRTGGRKDGRKARSSRMEDTGKKAKLAK